MPLFVVALLLCHSLLPVPLSSSSPAHPPPDRYFKSISHSIPRTAPQEYIELTNPLPHDRFTPTCSLLAFDHIFGNTVGLPPVSVGYSPPSSCPPPWSRVVLEFRASSAGEQYDRIAGIWLGGVEILRTSTAEPNDNGVFWTVRKDVTRYASLLRQSNLELTVMLENIVNDVFTGVYNVNLTLLYYKSGSIRIPSSCTELGLLNNDIKSDYETEKCNHNPLVLPIEAADGVEGPRNSGGMYETPADLIIPLSNRREEGFWFRIESESGVKFKAIRIPRNTRRAVLEIYVSFHGNDEFWYSNPPDSYITVNNLPTERGHGAYREVFVKIDGSFVGSTVPFPVIFTGGINPLFWEPVVAIGAFNLPSYDLDLTPFLGLLLDGKFHNFGLGVADSISFWLVNANIHLWLDHGSRAVQAKSTTGRTPALWIQKTSRFNQLDGFFEIEATRNGRFAGWVKSREGNLTTCVWQQFKFKNSITFDRNGTYKVVRQKVKTRMVVRVQSEVGSLINRTIVKRKYPLKVITTTVPMPQWGTDLMTTDVSHALTEKSSHGGLTRSLYNVQDSRGWMEVKDHSVLAGSAGTNQSFSSRDEFGCFLRIVAATEGRLVRDTTSFSCESSL
ncbi:Peptide-N(4)-(N-acetyl-beta-glucosaminyl)asparagine amidase [Bertholletia excelsa]